ncbi:uncharacterized protein [Dysidea avara]
MDHSGERLNIYCSMFMSNPSPCHECHWHRVLYNKSHYSDLSSGNNLDLRHTLTVEDGGYYTCSYDKDVRVFNYTFPVLIAPVITTNPVDQEVSIFNSFTINCTAKGSPIPSILWYLNNDLITNTDNRIIISTTTITQHSVTSTLTISSARYTDAGVYYCQTDGDNLNVETADISRYNSEIKYQNKISDSRLSVVSHSAAVTVVARLNHVSRWLRQSPDCPDRPINVQLFGVTSRGLFIDWTEPRDNNAPVTGYNITYQNPDCLVMAPNNQPQDVTVSSMERQAMIPNLHPGENYSFIVIAINDICASVPSIPVSVRTMEEAPAVAPMVATLVPTTTTINATWNELACQDRRGVIVHYEVRYNTSDFNEDRSLTLNTTLGDDTSLLIEDLEEFGNYTIEVRAHIAAGASPYNSPINVQTLPDIPSGPVTDLDVRNIDPTTVELSWGPVMAREQNGIILSYNIYYRQYDSISNDYFMITNITEMELNITGLNESQLYTIEVTANNQAGESDVNATIMIMTNESTPATTVQNIRIVNLTDPGISVVFTWDPPSDPNGFIRYYRVEFQEISDGSSGGRRKRITPINTEVMNAFANFTGPGEALTNITLDNLVAYQMYRYSVFAATSVGEGPPLDGTFITREDTPLAPNHLTVNYPGMPRNSTTLVVSWDRPSCDRGVLSGYELCYVPTSVGDCVSNGIRVNITSPETLWYTINDLSVNTNYAVEVRGRTGAGLGDPITAVNSTDEDAPTLVMNLRAVFTAGNDTRGVYTITWTPPAASNGSYYQQFSYSFTSAYTVGPQYNGTITERIEQGVNQHVIPDAFYFNDYTFTITTINIKYSTNNGPVQIQNQSSPAAPTAVRDLEAVPSSLTSIYLIWKHPEYPNSQLTQYIIYYRANPSVIQMFPGISSDDFNVSLPLSFPMTRYYLTGLSVFTNYSIHLSVMGNSVPNAPIEHEILERTNTSAIPDVIPGDDIKQINNTVTTIVVEWPVPNYYNASTTKYQLILCQKTNIDDCTGSISLTVDASGSDTIERYNITGLTPFTAYQLSISAVNEIGSSPFSSQVPIRTVNAMEAAVQGLNVTAYNNSEVTVTWMVPEYSELQDFVIMYFFKPEQAEMTIVDRPPYQLSDLIPGETYTVRVTSRYFNYINNIIAEADASEETITIDEIVTIPVISEQPMDQTVIPTHDVNFTCIGQAYGDVKVRWFRGLHDNPLVDEAIVTTTITANLITSVLTIPNVLTSDEGRYRCILTNSAGSTDSDFAQLAITFPRPTINSHPMDVIADNGSSVTFTCEVFSYIPASLTWLHNGEVLDEDPTRIITTTITNTNIYTTTLMILNVQLPDSGCYVCNATSILSDTAMLCVIDPNIVENRNLDIITSNNQSVEFQSPFRSGNISHYKVVVVIGDLSDNTTDIPDGKLLPYREALDNKLNYYVAIVGTVTNNNLTLGNGMTTSVDTLEYYYYNRPLNHSQIYSYFIRVYFQCCNETIYTTSHFSSSFEITSADLTSPGGGTSGDGTSGDAIGGIMGGVVVAIVIIVVLVVLIVWMRRSQSNGQDKTDGNESIHDANVLTTGIPSSVENAVHQAHSVTSQSTKLDYENKEVIDAHVKSILNTTLPNTDGKYERLSPIEAYKIAPEELTKSMEMEQQVYATPCKHVDCGAVYCQPSNNEQKIYEEFEGKRFCKVFHEEIEICEELGTGEFGAVSRAMWKPTKQEKVEVAVKTLKANVSPKDRVRFLLEAAIMCQFDHENVVKLHGVVTDEPAMIVLEYVPNGDLRSVLLQLKQVNEVTVYVKVPLLLLKFCQEIAAGIAYLNGKNFVHRDLAARNILVSQSHSCKIADFGMSRDLLDENYYITSGGRIPVKWTAPEALNYRKYSVQSDVWSYGCVLYEIWSLGCKPFGSLDNIKVLQKVDTGYRLPPPPGCPRAIYRVMIKCWNPEPKSRPQSEQITQLLAGNQSYLLGWSDNDREFADENASKLGAPLEFANNLYCDLQTTYRHNV